MTDYFKSINLQIRGELTSYYKRYGFEVEPDYTGFFKIGEGCRQEAFIGPTAEYSNSISYQPDLRVLNEQLEHAKEEIFRGVNVTGGTLFLESQGDKLARRFNVSDYEHWKTYSIENPKDASLMVAHHAVFMETAGMQFFNRTATLSGISTYLNEVFIDLPVASLTQDEKAKLIQHRGGRWMINGLISAWMTESKDFDRLVDVYRSVYYPTHSQEKLNLLLQRLPLIKK